MDNTLIASFCDAADVKKGYKSDKEQWEQDPWYLILAQMGLSVSSTDPILLIVSEMFSLSRAHKAKRSQ